MLLKPVLTLVRPLLSLGVSFSAFCMYVYCRHAADGTALLLFAGVFLLSCGASALNQLQERSVDTRMKRTGNRPLPRGLLAGGHAAAVAAGAGVCGLALLYFGSTPAAAGLGALATAVYNAVYTPCKKRTPLALFPGAFAGALPIPIGCAAATGGIDGKAVCIALFLFFWQIPHFLLLSLRYADDYRRAGVPALTDVMPVERVKIVIGIWALAASAVTALFPLLGVLRCPVAVTILESVNCIVLAGLWWSLRRKRTGPMEWGLYGYQGVVLVLLAVEGIAGGRG